MELILTDISFSDMLATNTDILQPWFLQMWLTMILSRKPSVDDAPSPVLQEHHVPIVSKAHVLRSWTQQELGRAIGSDYAT